MDVKSFLIIYVSYFFLITKKNKTKIMEDMAEFEPAIYRIQRERCTAEPRKSSENKI